MYATLKNNQLITPGHDGTQLVTDVDGPGVYQVRTCRVRGDVVEFGSGLVEIGAGTLERSADGHSVGLHVHDHKVEILTATTTRSQTLVMRSKNADYAQDA